MSWTSVTLAEVTTRPQYGAIAKGSDQPAGPLFVRQTDIKSGRIDWSTVPYCDLDYADSEKYAISPGDLLISRLGSVGNAAIVRESREAVFAGYLVRFRAKGDTLPEFLGYQLQSRQWREHVSSYRSGAAQPTLNAQQMGDFKFLLPPPDVQREIAATLGALDEKIESNQAIVEAAPSLIRALVQEALAVRGSEIPVSDLANFVNGGAYTKGASGSGRMVLRIAELNSGPGGSTVYNDIEVPDEKTARAGDILMSWSGSLGVYRWFRDEAIINQHIFKVIPTNYPAWLVFDRLDAVMPVFQGIAKDKATTMGHIQRGHLDTTRVEIPEDDAIAELGAVVEPLWERLLLAERENMTLVSLRDALLPQLLSGRVRVSGAATA